MFLVQMEDNMISRSGQTGLLLDSRDQSRKYTIITVVQE